jgi:hypothetical protein
MDEAGRRREEEMAGYLYILLLPLVYSSPSCAPVWFREM